MKICEFFFNAYKLAHESTNYGIRMTIKDISEKYDRGTYKYVECVFDHVCGACYDYGFKKAGITYDQYKKANTDKFLGHKEYSNWQARQLGQTQFYWLTKKGIKAIYKAYEGQW